MLLKWGCLQAESECSCYCGMSDRKRTVRKQIVYSESYSSLSPTGTMNYFQMAYIFNRNMWPGKQKNPAKSVAGGASDGIITSPCRTFTIFFCFLD